MSDKKIRILIAKPGLDGHDRGAKIVARALRDAGMEVVYTGLRQTPEQIISAAVQEDIHAIGVSILSGAHMYVFSRLLELARENNLDDVMIFGGGIVPEEDVKKLTEMGVAKIFTPGAHTEDIVTFIKHQIGEK
jgi:methylmalonyl-CoA mutase C-terminal domain/subunit